MNRGFSSQALLFDEIPSAPLGKAVSAISGAPDAISGDGKLIDHKTTQSIMPSTPNAHWDPTFWREFQKAAGVEPKWSEIEDHQFMESFDYPDNPDYSLFAGE